MGLFGQDEKAPEKKTQQPPRKADASPARGSEKRTVVARPTTIEGRVLGPGEVLVEGMIKGTVEIDGKVRVAEKGRVEAEVHARLVTVAGTIIGNITADDRIVLEPTAQVDGNITAPRILIEDGATFKGQVNMKAPEKSGTFQTSSAGKDPAVR
jgi:cytoskeletal protein CcmA (bactofilin family)